MDCYMAKNFLLMTYKGLTNNLIRPKVTHGLNDFLDRVKGVTTINTVSISFIWRAVVKIQPLL